MHPHDGRYERDKVLLRDRHRRHEHDAVVEDLFLIENEVVIIPRFFSVRAGARSLVG